MSTDTQRHQGCSTGTFRWVLGGLLVVAAFFLFTEHRAHLFGALPYLLLLACPLMHLFMHRGHGAHQHHGEQERRPPGESDSSSPPKGP